MVYISDCETLQNVDKHGYNVGINDKCTNAVIIKIELAVSA